MKSSRPRKRALRICIGFAVGDDNIFTRRCNIEYAYAAHGPRSRHHSDVQRARQPARRSWRPCTQRCPRPTSWSSTTTRPTAPARSPTSWRARDPRCSVLHRAGQAGARHRLRRRLPLGARATTTSTSSRWTATSRTIPSTCRCCWRRRAPAPIWCSARATSQGGGTVNWGAAAQAHLARRQLLRAHHPRRRRARPHRRLQVLPPPRARGHRPRQRRRAGLRLPDRDDLSHAQAGLPRRTRCRSCSSIAASGQSKMSKKIFLEALTLVWKLRLARLRDGGAGSDAGSVWIDGAPVDAAARACRYSTAASSTATRSTRCCAPSAESRSRSREHLDRLERSAARLLHAHCRRAPPSRGRSTTRCAAAGEADAYMRIIVTRGAGEIALDPGDGRPAAPGHHRAAGEAAAARGLRDGVEVAIVGAHAHAPRQPASRRPAGEVGQLSRSACWRWPRRARRGAYEAILCDNVGRITEGGSSNFFVVRGGRITHAAALGRPARGHHPREGDRAAARTAASPSTRRRSGRSICAAPTRRS